MWLDSHNSIKRSYQAWSVFDIWTPNIGGQPIDPPQETDRLSLMPKHLRSLPEARKPLLSGFTLSVILMMIMDLQNSPNPMRRAPVLAVDREHVFINYPFCDKVHVHYSNGDISSSDYGTRLSHCRDLKLHANYELVCDNSTLRREKFERSWIERTFGKIEDSG
jgi:hypothetical protein